MKEIIEFTKKAEGVRLLTTEAPLVVSWKDRFNDSFQTNILALELLTEVPVHQMFSQLDLPFDGISLRDEEIGDFIDQHPGWLNSKHYFANYFLRKRTWEYWEIANVDCLLLPDGSHKLNGRVYLGGENHARPSELKLRIFIKQPI